MENHEYKVSLIIKYKALRKILKVELNQHPQTVSMIANLYLFKLFLLTNKCCSKILIIYKITSFKSLIITPIKGKLIA